MNKKENKISVIIPMYNVENYIEQCITSIENQTYQNLEIIMVDDGSSDLTLMKAKQLKEKYNNIKLISQKNGGQAKARNIGLSVAKGEYISFIDADDFISKKMYEIMLSKMKKNNLDLIEANYQDVFMQKNKYGIKYTIKNIDENSIYNGKEYFELKPSLSPCNKLYSFNYLKKINFKCSEGHYAEDAYDTSNIILKSSRIMYIDEVVYYYRRDNENSTRNNSNIDRRIKLGKDKLYISNRLEELRKELKIKKGTYLSNIIVRNSLGSFVSPLFFKSNKYKKEIKREFKKIMAFNIIKNNLTLKIVIELFITGLKRLFKKGG